MKRKVQYNVPCTTVPFSLRVSQAYHTVQQIVSKCRERGKYTASAPIGSNSNGGRHFSICSFSSQTMHILFFVSARLLLAPLLFLQPLCTLHSSSSSPSSLRDRVFFFLDLDGWCQGLEWRNPPNPFRRYSSVVLFSFVKRQQLHPISFSCCCCRTFFVKGAFLIVQNF